MQRLSSNIFCCSVFGGFRRRNPPPRRKASPPIEEKAEAGKAPVSATIESGEKVVTEKPSAVSASPYRCAVGRTNEETVEGKTRWLVRVPHSPQRDRMHRTWSSRK